MKIELYIGENFKDENSQIYIPDFTHHEFDNFSAPQGESWTTPLELKQKGFTLLKEIDITKRPSIKNKNPIHRTLFVFGMQ